MTDKPRVSDDHYAAICQELWLGPNANIGSLFADREELEAAWREHRAEVMAMFARGGRRPMAWWQFEAPPGLRYDDDRERSILWEAAILIGEERVEVEREWRKAFEAAQSLDVKDRRRHYRSADIPSALVETWTAERRRRGARIRNLKAGTGGSAATART